VIPPVTLCETIPLGTKILFHERIDDNFFAYRMSRYLPCKKIGPTLLCARIIWVLLIFIEVSKHLGSFAVRTAPEIPE
jgi:hypothetical protein